MGGSGGKGGGQPTTTTTTNNSPWAGAQPNWFNYYGMMNDWYFGEPGSKYSGGDYSGMSDNQGTGGGGTGGNTGGGGGGNDVFDTLNDLSPFGLGPEFNEKKEVKIAGADTAPDTAPYSERSNWMNIARDRFVGADPLTLEAWNLKEALARSGDSSNNAAYKLGMDTLGGQYLNSNPYIDKTYNRAADQVQSRVNSQFGLAGRTGSGMNQSVMANDLGNLANDIYGQNYQQERNRQQQMMAFAPMLDQLRYADVNQLGQIGNEKRTYAEARQNAPLAALQQYGSMLAPGMNYGTTSTTQPLYGGGSALGAGAGSLAALIALMAGQPGLATMLPGLGSGIGGMFG